MMLVITGSGLQAIGVVADEKTNKRSRSTKTQPKKRRDGIVQKPTKATPKGTKSQTAVRIGTKQGLLIERVREDRVGRYRIAEDRKAA